MTVDDGGVRERIIRLDRLLGELEMLPTAPARTRAIETVQALIDLYGDGLARIVAAAAASAPELVRQLADDALVGHLLLVHELHPDTVEQRIAAALEEARPLLGGAEVRLAGIEGDVARIQLTGGAGGGCGSEPPERIVEEAVSTWVPELDGVVFEPRSVPQPVSLGRTRRAGADASPAESWSRTG